METYLVSYLAGGLYPLWTRTVETPSEAAAVKAARMLLRTHAEVTVARPLTLLLGVGKDEEHARWLGGWTWAPNEFWSSF